MEPVFCCAAATTQLTLKCTSFVFWSTVCTHSACAEMCRDDMRRMFSVSVANNDLNLLLWPGDQLCTSYRLSAQDILHNCELPDANLLHDLDASIINGLYSVRQMPLKFRILLKERLPIPSTMSAPLSLPWYRSAGGQCAALPPPPLSHRGPCMYVAREHSRSRPLACI